MLEYQKSQRLHIFSFFKKQQKKMQELSDYAKKHVIMCQQLEKWKFFTKRLI